MLSGGFEPPLVDGNESERRTRERVAGRPALGVRMLDRSYRCRPRLVELARQVEGSSATGQCGYEDLVCTFLREVDRSPALRHRPADTAFHRRGPHHRLDRLCVAAEALWVLRSGATREPKKTPQLERRVADRRRGGCRDDDQLRMLDKRPVRQRSHEAKERPGAAASVQAQVILHEELGDELVLTRCRRVLDRFDRQATRAEPVRRTPVNLSCGAGLFRCKLELRELGEQWVDPIPASGLQTIDEQIGA